MESRLAIGLFNHDKNVASFLFLRLRENIYFVFLFDNSALREKCTSSKLFLSAFSRIRTEYGTE